MIKYLVLIILLLLAGLTPDWLYFVIPTEKQWDPTNQMCPLPATGTTTRKQCISRNTRHLEAVATGTQIILIKSRKETKITIITFKTLYELEGGRRKTIYLVTAVQSNFFFNHACTFKSTHSQLLSPYWQIQEIQDTVDGNRFALKSQGQRQHLLFQRKGLFLCWLVCCGVFLIK